MFTSGTMGELAPVLEVDGRTIGEGEVGPMTRQLQILLRARTQTEGEILPF
jgi:branched-subunit amino acid aminotransferase/4-amino-4-deoxychorismate lyase